MNSANLDGNAGLFESHYIVGADNKRLEAYAITSALLEAAVDAGTR
jgi:hypothetical protein